MYSIDHVSPQPLRHTLEAIIDRSFVAVNYFGTPVGPTQASSIVGLGESHFGTVYVLLIVSYRYD